MNDEMQYLHPGGVGIIRLGESSALNSAVAPPQPRMHSFSPSSTPPCGRLLRNGGIAATMVFSILYDAAKAAPLSLSRPFKA